MGSLEGFADLVPGTCQIKTSRRMRDTRGFPQKKGTNLVLAVVGIQKGRYPVQSIRERKIWSIEHLFRCPLDTLTIGFDGRLPVPFQSHPSKTLCLLNSFWRIGMNGGFPFLNRRTMNECIAIFGASQLLSGERRQCSHIPAKPFKLQGRRIVKYPEVFFFLGRVCQRQ